MSALDAPRCQWQPVGVFLLPELLGISQAVPLQEGEIAEGLLSLLGLICLEVNVKFHFPLPVSQGTDEALAMFPDSSALQSKDIPRGRHILTHRAATFLLQRLQAGSSDLETGHLNFYA